MEELEKKMYFKATAVTLEAARILRKNMTMADQLKWKSMILGYLGFLITRSR